MSLTMLQRMSLTYRGFYLSVFNTILCIEWKLCVWSMSYFNYGCFVKHLLLISFYKWLKRLPHVEKV